MNTAAHNFGYDVSSAGSSTSGSAMLLILQILPQLEVLKTCRDGWKAMAHTAKDEAEMLRFRIAKQQITFKQTENEYDQRISSLGLRMQRAINEKQHVKNILLDTAVQLQKLQNHSRTIVANFSSEKEKFMNKINENNMYILTNKQFLKNVSMELKSILNNTTDRSNSTQENENNFEHEIKKSLEVLAKRIQTMSKELIEKNNKITEITESYNELMEENKNCISTKEEMQEELDEANELEETLKEIKQEKQKLQDTNENLLKQILSVVESTATHHSATLETIWKQTSSAARGIQKYIVEPVEEAHNLTLKLILKARTKEEALISAVKKGNITEMSLLLDYGADIEGEDSNAWKPLHWAADEGHWKAVRLLLLREADVNAHSGFHNATALHMAVIKNHLNVIDLLLKGGADIEAKDAFGFTPLFRAITQDCATAKLLVDRGANVNTTNDKGITAVSLAYDCVRDLLCSKGATDPLCRSHDKTATAMPCSS